MTVFADTYDTATPPGGGDPTEADDRMRETKAAIQQRMDVDHYWEETGTEVSDPDTGEHRKVTLRTGSAPSAVADKGFVYVKDVSGKAELFYRDEDGDEVQLTSGGVVLLDAAVLPNATYIRGRNAADNGFINIIKVHTNDQIAFGVKAVLADESQLTTTALPTTDVMIANKAYVDDQDAADHPTYSGGESHTDGSGLITKMGKTGSGSVDQSVSFGEAFPNDIISLSIQVRKDSGTAEAVAHTISAAGFSIRINVVVQDCYWIAKGH